MTPILARPTRSARATAQSRTFQGTSCIAAARSWLASVADGVLEQFERENTPAIEHRNQQQSSKVAPSHFVPGVGSFPTFRKELAPLLCDLAHDLRFDVAFIFQIGQALPHLDLVQASGATYFVHVYVHLAIRSSHRSQGFEQSQRVIVAGAFHSFSNTKLQSTGLLVCISANAGDRQSVLRRRPPAAATFLSSFERDPVHRDRVQTDYLGDLGIRHLGICLDEVHDYRVGFASVGAGHDLGADHIRRLLK